MSVKVKDINTVKDRFITSQLVIGENFLSLNECILTFTQIYACFISLLTFIYQWKILFSMKHDCLIPSLQNLSMDFTYLPSDNTLITKFFLFYAKLFMDKLCLMSHIWITTRGQLRSSCSNVTTLVELRTLCVSLGDWAFSALAPRLLNRLPSHIKDSTFQQFKKLWKRHLFKNAYQQ